MTGSTVVLCQNFLCKSVSLAAFVLTATSNVFISMSIGDPSDTVYWSFCCFLRLKAIVSLQSYSEIESALLNDDNEAYYEDIDEDEIEEYMESIESKEQLLH